MVTKDDILEAMKTVCDPELRVNIVDLGLVYGVEVTPDNVVRVRMTLTSMMCPAGTQIQLEAEEKILKLGGVRAVDFDLVWDPPWSPEKMTEVAKMELGLM
ncbi:MAG: DUF59 domain-containing protein [Candidatus Aenigmarchaeota archaeon]|nr:DUF59 domain-containing protein [Candidatus Aenigmarchaeota archaeon]